MRKYLYIILVGLFIQPIYVAYAAENTVSQTEENRIFDELIWAAQLSFEQKNYNQAVELYHHILSRDPSIVQVRFSLAESYLLLKQYDQAQYHFKLVLAQEVPQEIVSLIHNHLAFINRQKIWQVAFGFDVMPESNINQGAKNKTIIIAGVPFILSDDSLAKAGMSLNTNGALVISPQIDGGLYGHFKVSATGSYLTASQQLNYSFGGELGLSVKQESNKYSVGLAYKQQYFDRKLYSSKVGIWSTWNQLLSDKLSWDGRISVDQLTFNGIAGADYILGTSQTFRYEQNANFGFTISPSISYKKSQNKMNDNVVVALSVGTRHSLPHNFTINTNLSAQYGQYVQKNQLFDKYRKDITLGASVKITNSKFRIFDFAPYVELRFQKRNSSIGFYEFDNQAITVGLTKYF